MNQSKQPQRLDQVDARIAQCTDVASFIALSEQLVHEYDATGDLHRIRSAKYCADRGVEMTPTNDPMRSNNLSASVSALFRNYKHTGEEGLLSLAIDRAREALLSFLGDEAMRWNKVQNVSFLLEEEISLACKQGLQSRSLELGERAICEVPEGHPGHARLLLLLSRLLHSRYKYQREESSLTRAVVIIHRAAEPSVINVVNPVDRAAIMDMLFMLLETQYDIFRDRNHLFQLISLAEEERTKCYQVQRARNICRLGKYLAWKFINDEGSMNCLDRAIHLGRSFKDIPDESPHRLSALEDLIFSYCLKHDQNGRLHDVEEAIQLVENEAQARNQRLQHVDMGGLLVRRYEITGDLNDLEKAIDIDRSQLERLENVSDDRCRLLCCLANTLRLRYERTGNVENLIEAMQKSEEAFRTQTTDRAGEIFRHNTRALCLAQNYVRSTDLEDLQPAIEHGRSAIAKLPPKHIDRFKLLNNLGIWLGWSYEQTKEPAELDECIGLIEEALNKAPLKHLTRGDCLSNLCGFLKWKYDRTESPVHLDESINYGRKAIEQIPKHRPRRALALAHLSGSLAAKSDEDGATATRKEAIEMMIESLKLEASPPAHRLNKVFDSLPWLERHREWRNLSLVTEMATRLLPLVSPRSLQQTDQQYMLRRYAGLASQAAAAALEVGKPKAHALGLLELGRGVITSIILQNRRDITWLHKKHPIWAKRLVELRDTLDPPCFTTSSAGSWVKATSATHLLSEARSQANEELNKLLRKIRTQKGFENFLLPPTTVDMVSAVRSEESIVVINVSTFRSDAFLIRPGGIVLVRLPDLTREKVANAARDLRFNNGVGDASNVLEWLWDAAICTILTELGVNVDRNGQDCSRWPRVYWIPTGPLRLLPLHAAGYHHDYSRRSVLDRVVSSYGLSLEEILHGRNSNAETPAVQQESQTDIPGHLDSKNTQTEQLFPRFVIVTMEKTPGARPLKYAAQEGTAVQAMLPSSYSHVYNPLRPDLLSELQNCNVFHFAGHGMIHATDPSLSGLLLTDEKGCGTKPLTVRDLQALRFQKRGPPLLAYLSACSTGRIEDDKLGDEGIHLMGACRLAGFRHVIGSLWEVLDPVCVTLADSVYSHIIKENLNDHSVAVGLHCAVRRLREQSQGPDDRLNRNALKVTVGSTSLGPPGPPTWTAFIHMGL